MGTEINREKTREILRFSTAAQPQPSPASLTMRCRENRWHTQPSKLRLTQPQSARLVLPATEGRRGFVTDNKSGWRKKGRNLHEGPVLEKVLLGHTHATGWHGMESHETRKSGSSCRGERRDRRSPAGRQGSRVTAGGPGGHRFPRAYSVCAASCWVPGLHSRSHKH